MPSDTSGLLVDAHGNLQESELPCDRTLGKTNMASQEAESLCGATGRRPRGQEGCPLRGRRGPLGKGLGIRS